MDIDRRLLVPAPVRRFPADLAVIVAFVLSTCLCVLLPVVRDSLIRPLIVLPFVLFAPGYAFIAAVFPEGTREEQSSSDADTIAERVWVRYSGGIDGLERVALSFGTSIALVPLIGLLLNFTPWGIRLLPVLLSVGGFTILAAIVGAVRRWDLPEEERFSVPFRRWSGTVRAELFEPETRTDVVLNIVLVVCLLLAAASVTYAVAVPKNEEHFTEVYLLTKNESGGYVSSGYPTDFTAGESKPLYVGVQNHEHRREAYTVVVLVQRVRTRNGSTAVQREREMARFHPTVGPNGTWRTKQSVEPQVTGNHLRLRYLLYKGNAPPDPDAENAYREVHLWINVSGKGAP